MDLGFRQPFVGWADALPSQQMAGRVTSVHRGFVDVVAVRGAPNMASTSAAGLEERPEMEFARVPIGPRLRRTPIAVGDWVAVDGSPLVVVEVAPRVNVLRRRAVGSSENEQVLAANIDVALVMTALAEDFSLRRIERYLAVVREGGVTPVIVLSKADLCPDWPKYVDEVRSIAGDAVVMALSVHTQAGLDDVDRWLVGPDGSRTIVLLGSSGVGKSTLINRWIGVSSQRVQGTRDDGKGRHTTTRRSLFVVPGGGIVIDTPGMREIGMLGAEEGVAATFADIAELAARCRFRDCRHDREPGCAVREATERGDVDRTRLEAYRTLMRETAKTPPGPRRQLRR